MMIERIRGELLEKNPRHVVVDCGGVGYGLSISTTTYENLPAPGGKVDLFVHTHVREDTLELFGFAAGQEREVFLILQTISGVGPSLALTLLSSLATGNIARAVESGDSAVFKRVKGVGQKTAERLVLELKGKLKDFEWDGGNDGAAAGVLSEIVAARDSIAALMNLGMKYPQAEKAVAAAINTLGADASVEQIIVEGLKWRKS